jgi:3-oxoadipate enol-lactonase
LNADIERVTQTKASAAWIEIMNNAGVPCGMIRSTPPQGYAGCCHAIAGLNLTERLNAITLPTLIIVGEDDPGTPVAASRTIHEQMQGSELVILQSAAHLSNLEQPEAFNQALIQFLAQHAAR